MMKKFKNFIKSIDVFSEPVSLYFYQKKSFSTFLGGLLTVSMITLLLLFTKNHLQSVFYRSNINLTLSDNVNIHPPLIDLRNRFSFNIWPPNFNEISKKRYFNFLIGLGVWDYNTEGNYVLETSYINVTKCTEKHFPILSPDQFKIYSISDSLCPDFDDQNFDFSVEGTWGAGKYQFIEISIKECISKGENDICANETEINQIKAESGEGLIYINLNLINNVLNFTNHDQPFTYFQETSETLMGLDNFYKQNEIRLTKVSISTDDTYSFNFLRNDDNNIQHDSFVYDRKIDGFLLAESKISKIDNSKIYFSSYLRSDIISKNYVRKYDSFEDYLQVIGSLYSIFYAIFKLSSYFLNKNKFDIKVGKDLYSLSKENTIKKQVINKKVGLTNILANFIRKIFFKNNNIKQNYNVNSIKKAVIKEMDLIQLLMKLKEIENLKRIFFSEDQKVVVNFLAQPKFEESEVKSNQDLVYGNKIYNRSIVSFKRKTQLYDNASLNLYENFFKAFGNLQERKNDLDKKIINLIDKKLIHEMNCKISKLKNKTIKNTIKERDKKTNLSSKDLKDSQQFTLSEKN